MAGDIDLRDDGFRGDGRDRRGMRIDRRPAEGPDGKLHAPRGDAPDGEMHGPRGGAPDGEMHGTRGGTSDGEMHGTRSGAPDGEMHGPRSGPPDGEMHGTRGGAPDGEMHGTRSGAPDGEVGPRGGAPDGEMHGTRGGAPVGEVGPGRGSPAEVEPNERAARDPERGRHAEAPQQIPLRGWKDVLARTAAEAKRDQMVLLAAGVAFFGLLALVPALLATVAIYGLVADPAEVSRHVTDMLGAAPSEVRELIERQLETVTSETPSSIGIGLGVAVVVALWSASSGMKHLMDALNAAYDEVEGRKFLEVRGIALALTAGAILFVVASITALTVVPRVVEGSVLGDTTKLAINIARWPALAIAFTVGLAVLYRYGPSRDKAEWRWVSPGAAAATALWLIGSGLFSVYVANFSSFNETYGSLGSVIIAMLWLVLTALAVLLGAELDAELERQTRYDTTEGRSAPMGDREAYAADTVGPTADEVKAAKRQQQARASR